MGARRRGRESALQILYHLDTVGGTVEQGVNLYYGTLADSAAGRQFAELLVRGVDDEKQAVDDAIQAASHHWRLNRMSRVDRNVLRVGAYELLFCDDIPRRVTLNEAVELAKRFGSEGSGSFVNGLLDRIADEAGKE